MRTRTLLACAMLAALAPSSLAQITCYDDHTAWLAAAGTPDATEDFSSFVADTSFEGSVINLAVGSITVFSGGVGFRNFVDVPPLFFTDNNGTHHASSFTDLDTNTRIRITLSAPSRAFGCTVHSAIFEGGEGLKIGYLSGGVEIGSCSPTTSGLEFVGAVSTQLFDTVEFSSLTSLPDGTGEGFGLDDLEVMEGALITMTCAGDGTGFACPCGNTGTPADGRGCNNSANTGGGRLTGAGSTSLGSDTLTLTATDLRTSSLSVLVQATAQSSGGVFGDGVACLDGNFTRLFIGSASLGTKTYTGISSQSSTRGDTIVPGQLRLYHVFYRDRDDAFCVAPPSNFNTTNGVRVVWLL